MKFEELKPGMLFEDNDKRRAGRFARIAYVYDFSVRYRAGDDLESEDSWPLFTSKKPERFHATKRSKGFTLVRGLEEQ